MALLLALTTPTFAQTTDAASIEAQTAASSDAGMLIPVLTFILIAAVLLKSGGGGAGGPVEIILD